MHNTAQRLKQLRDLMRLKEIAAYIIPGTDPFLSEYLPDCWNQRAFISGFTGSAGKVIVTLEKAGLWTDSRYFLQAEEELKGSGIELFKVGNEETPSQTSWLISQLSSGSFVGINPMLISVVDYQNLEKDLSTKQIRIKNSNDLIDEIWTDRPNIPLNNVIILSDSITGETVESKLKSLRNYLHTVKLDALFISSLDDIAWLFNMRGTDIDFNPVCISFAMVTLNNAFLYIHPEKVTKELSDIESIKCIPMNEIEDHLKHQSHIFKIGFDPTKLNQGIYQILQQSYNVIEMTSWVTYEKSIKNKTELEGIEQAMVKDGVALVQFYMWLENELLAGRNPGEYEVGIQLKEFRNKQDAFVDESFSTIAGYQQNGAIVHYSAKQNGDKKLKQEGIFLLDSGGQYEHGTTDITRTIALGETSEQASIDYTLVLKGHLALSHATFPLNTRGDQLDSLARQFLWQYSLDYGHGTGHGVGHFLNVHEGPQSIRKEHNPVILKPGMVCSVEPGIYRSGTYGIRIENLCAVQEKETTEFGQFLSFKTLTLFPYDVSLIKKDMLSKREINLINNYHKLIFEGLSSYLKQIEKDWLAQKTLPI